VFCLGIRTSRDLGWGFRAGGSGNPGGRGSPSDNPDRIVEKTADKLAWAWIVNPPLISLLGLQNELADERGQEHEGGLHLNE
jgi:hypothetical protein